VEKKEWIDERHRKYLVLVDEGVPPDEYHMCPIIGPPRNIVDCLDWPEELKTRLHNILYDRKLWNIEAIRRQKNALFGALQAALRVDQHTLMTEFEKYAKGV
jgi:hypothetical protein